LFFDLVFVVAVAALAHQLHDDHSLTGLAVFAGLFVPVWWAWRGFAWYATGFDTDDRAFRVALLAGMRVPCWWGGSTGAQTQEADPMSSWSLTLCTGQVEFIEADRIEVDGNGWSWWTVVVVINEPRWACVRRVSAAEVVGEPRRGDP